MGRTFGIHRWKAFNYYHSCWSFAGVLTPISNPDILGRKNRKFSLYQVNSSWFSILQYSPVNWFCPHPQPFSKTAGVGIFQLVLLPSSQSKNIYRSFLLFRTKNHQNFKAASLCASVMFIVCSKSHFGCGGVYVTTFLKSAFHSDERRDSKTSRLNLGSAAFLANFPLVIQFQFCQNLNSDIEGCFWIPHLDIWHRHVFDSASWATCYGHRALPSLSVPGMKWVLVLMKVSFIWSCF